MYSLFFVISLFFQDMTDLLENKKGIKIRNNVDNEVVIENLTEQAVISCEEAIALVHKGIRMYYYCHYYHSYYYNFYDCW